MNSITVSTNAATTAVSKVSTPQARLEGQYTEITPRSFLSQLSQMRAAVGDARLSPESLAAIQHGALPPKIRTPEENTEAEQIPETQEVQSNPEPSANKTTQQPETASTTSSTTTEASTEITEVQRPPITSYPSGKHFQLTLSYANAAPVYTSPIQQVDIIV